LSIHRISDHDEDYLSLDTTTFSKASTPVFEELGYLQRYSVHAGDTTTTTKYYNEDNGLLVYANLA